MTTELEPLTTLPTDTQAVIDLATVAAEPNQLELGTFYVITTAQGGVQRIDLTGDQYRELPRRKTGTTWVENAASFLAYWAKHSDDGSEIFAHVNSRTVTAVLDADWANAARWGQHRLTLKLAHSKPFTAWCGIDGSMLPQDQFAEFVEDNQADIADPDAATLLEIVQTMQGATKVEWVSGTVLASGARRLVYQETAQAAAGQRGELEIPQELRLQLPVFDGADVLDPMTARMRYRIRGGDLYLGIRLDRPEDVVRRAFADVLTEIGDGVAVPILQGTQETR